MGLYPYVDITSVFYVVIFGMWVVWVEKVRVITKMRGSERAKGREGEGEKV